MHKETAKTERNVMLSDSSADVHMFSRESVTGSGWRDLIAPFFIQSSPYIHLELATTQES